MTNRFKDAVVIITGGASGIGKSLADQLNVLGAHLIIVGRNKDSGLKQVQFLNALDGQAIFKQADMTRTDEVKRMIDSVLRKYGRIDYMFNVAGNFMGGEIRDTPIENWPKVINNNIWATSNGTHFAYQAMLKQGSGHIINFASAAGLFPVPAMGIYGASKFAIVGLSRALRIEAKSLGVKVSVVCPTVVNTPLYDTAIYNDINKPKALKGRKSLQTPEVAAKRTIKGVLKNRAIIHTSASTKIAWWAYKYMPLVYDFFARRFVVYYRNKLRLKEHQHG